MAVMTGTEAARKPTVKGVEALLTVNDLALLMQKPTRFVRSLIKSGALRGIKLGGNSWRVTRAEWDRFISEGATGHRFARPSGGVRPGMWGATGGGEERAAAGEYPRGTE
jgi:excisionase family DNA binding protein